MTHWIKIATSRWGKGGIVSYTENQPEPESVLKMYGDGLSQGGLKI
jgi:hypothetical protein